MESKCFIIGAGDLTISELRISEEDFVIAADGGLSYCEFLGVRPNVILGDFDSVGEKEKNFIENLVMQGGEGDETSIPEIVRLPEEKDDTDMLAAIKYGLEKGYRDFRIYAGMGGRFDHSFANIQCLLYLKNHVATGYLCDGTGMILVLQDESVEFQESMEGIVSVFALGRQAKGVTIRGMKYPLENAVITNDFPIGISNEFIGQKAYISVKEGELLCVVQWVG